MQISEIEFPHVIYFTYSSLGLIWQLSHYNYQKKNLPLYKCISIFPSQYKHSCEPITSKFKSWLFLSLASLENVEHSPGERLPSSAQRSFFFLISCFLLLLLFSYPAQMRHTFSPLLLHLFSIFGDNRYLFCMLIWIYYVVVF